MERTVYFRAFEEDDSELIYQWKNDDEIQKMTVGLNRRMCREEALDMVRAIMRHRDDRVYWAICAKDTNKMIGYASLINIHHINRSAVFGGLIIGDKEYQDGMAWIESYLFVYEYGFERLNLNRIEGTILLGHKASSTMGNVMFSVREGVLRQAAFKNGKYYDVALGSLLREEYFLHKEKGDYEIPAILRRLTNKIRESKKARGIEK